MPLHRSLAPLGFIACALAAAGPASAGDAPGGFPGTVVFSGSDYKEDVSFSYFGGVHALNGNLGRDGFLVRVFAGFGDYQYGTEGVPEGHVETDLTLVDLGVGYQALAGAFRLSAYANASYEDHDQSPEDTANSIRGDAWGFKAQLEAETTAEAPVYAGVIASYSTGFDSYWVRGRAGLKVGHGIAIGPEIIALGNEEFQQMRYGAFVSGLPSILGMALDIDSKTNLAIGYADSDEDGSARAGDDSIYGSIGTSFSF